MVRDVEHGRRIVAWGVLVVTASAGIAVSVTGFVLADRYRPPGPWVRHGSASGSHRLVDINDAVIGVFSGLALLIAFAAVVPRFRSMLGLTVWSTVGALVSLAAAFATGATRVVVQYDQVALWAVSVGTDIRGYWAATGDRARFVIVDGFEVPTAQYTATLIVHLAAPVVALVGVGVIGWDLRRRSGRRRDG